MKKILFILALFLTVSLTNAYSANNIPTDVIEQLSKSDSLVVSKVYIIQGSDDNVYIFNEKKILVSKLAETKPFYESDNLAIIVMAIVGGIVFYKIFKD